MANVQEIWETMEAAGAPVVVRGGRRVLQAGVGAGQVRFFLRLI